MLLLKLLNATNQIHLQSTGVETDITKPGQIKPKLTPCLDAHKGA